MTTAEIIHVYENSRLQSDNFTPDAVTAAYVSGLSALHEKSEREVNDPLTLDELREMDGEPVWVSWAGHSSEGWALVRVWSKVNSTIYMTYHNGATDLLGYILNNGAKIYRHKPEEGTK